MKLELDEAQLHMERPMFLTKDVDFCARQRLRESNASASKCEVLWQGDGAIGIAFEPALGSVEGLVPDTEQSDSTELGRFLQSFFCTERRGPPGRIEVGKYRVRGLRQNAKAGRARPLIVCPTRREIATLSTSSLVRRAGAKQVTKRQSRADDDSLDWPSARAEAPLRKAEDLDQHVVQ